MYYKGYTIYWISSNRWRVQVGYDCIGDYKTIGAAKAAVTREIKKMKITAQQLKAMFLSKSFNDQIQKVLCNVMFNGYSVDHVLNRFGHAVLAFRVYGGQLHVTDRTGADVTDLYITMRG